MRKLFIILSILIVAAVTYYLIMYIFPSHLNQRSVDINPLEYTSIKLQSYEHQEFIHAIELEVKGEIVGSGVFSYGDSDTTIYRAQKVDTGKINLELGGDWYSNECYINFKPVNVKSGSLKVCYRFYGSNK